MALKFGVELPQHMSAAHLLWMAREAEAMGYDSVWVRDHLIVSPLEMSRFQQAYLDGGRRVVSGGYLGCVPALAAVAAVTTRVAIGTDVINIARRHPVDVANEMAAVDEVSAGRLIVQGAVGHPTRDWEPLGLEKTPRQRGEMLEEALAIIRALWASEEPLDFDGSHYRLRQVRIGSRPVQSPGPPIWLGVEKTLGRVARLADGFTLTGSMFGGGLEHFRAAVEQVRNEAVAAGREPDQIIAAARFAVVLDRDGSQAKRRADRDWGKLWERPQEWYRRWAGDPDEVAAVITPYLASGARHVMLWPLPYAGTEALRDLELFAAEVIPRLRRQAASA